MENSRRRMSPWSTRGSGPSLLVLSGSYNDLLTYTVFASLLFNAMTVIGLFKLRLQKPALERPYRVSGYPLVPLLYVASAAFFIVYIIVGDPRNSGRGLFLLATGVPAYLYWKGNERCPPSGRNLQLTNFPHSIKFPLTEEDAHEPRTEFLGLDVHGHGLGSRYSC